MYKNPQYRMANEAMWMQIVDNFSSSLVQLIYIFIVRKEILKFRWSKIFSCRFLFDDEIKRRGRTMNCVEARFLRDATFLWQTTVVKCWSRRKRDWKDVYGSQETRSETVKRLLRRVIHSSSAETVFTYSLYISSRMI